MSAPTANLDALRELGADWNGYGAVAISERALRVAEAVAFVPLADGGIQIELHAAGWDLEMEIAPDGSIQGFFADRPPKPLSEDPGHLPPHVHARGVVVEERDRPPFVLDEEC